ncbi:MAG: PAS domain S-box protein, partial [Chloroflexota bacterium]|nr:PAS domain S-box protein [Chloroflexota bacterium]
MKQKIRMLLVEDDKVDRMAFERFVEREGLPYDCVIAGSVLAAKKALVDVQFDAVLLDYLLGDGTAFDLLEEARDAVVIVITGSGDEEIAVRAMKAGAYDYMVKDVEGSYLTALPVVVENAVRCKRAEEELEQYREHLEELVKERTGELRQEIAERVRTQESLRESEERYRTVVEYQTDLLNRFRPDGTLTFVNRAYCRYFGKQRDELIGSGITSFVPQEDREELTDYLASFGPEKRVGRIERRSVAAGGKIRWVQWINRPILDERGDVIEFQSVGRDITGRVRAERALQKQTHALRESEERFRSVVQTASDAIITIDEHSNIALWNRAAAAMFGYSADEAIGQPITLIEPERFHKAHQEGMQRAVSTGETKTVGQTVEMVGLRKNGVEFPIELSLAVWKIDERTLFTSIIRDVTERVRSEEEQVRIEQQLRQQEQLAAMGQLAGGIAHDFNNMLTVVLLYAYQLLRQEAPSAGTVSAAEIIIKESKRASKLVGQILDFSRRSPLDISPLDLKPFVEEIVRVLERTIPESIHIQFDAGPEEATPFTVDADPTRIQQALTNLATNARDAMPEGGELGIELSRLEIASDETAPVAGMSSGEWISLLVSDTGTGIPPHVLDHIFEPFFTTKMRGEGTGLGLAQVDGIVAQHGGYIGVETEPGEGTTFRIYLPASGSQEMVVEEETTAPPRGQGETILLVEDNEALRGAGQEILKSLGYRVLSAANGREALEVYRAMKGIDMVITDLVMPKMGGRELMRELRKANPDVKALVITGYVMQEGLEELKEEGFLDVVHKPFEVEGLARVVRRELDEK